MLNPAYGWEQQCQERFGTHPIEIVHDWNSVAHLLDYEGSAGRRPFTREELQMFFDHIDAQVEKAEKSGRKGALTAYRDATMFKTIYAWGLRRTETSRMDTVDFYRNAKAPELGNYGMLQVRYGKRTRGSAPKRREVPTLMPWIIPVLEDYLVNIRPLFGHTEHPAVWLTERRTRLQPGDINDRFARYREELKLPKVLTPHCLRHSWVTHLIEDGADPKLIQAGAGHEYQSTTAI